MDVSSRTKDYFDFVIDDDLIYKLPDSPDRWPDEGNGGDEPDDPPPTVEVKTSCVFVATQEGVSECNVRSYATAIKNGADMPPVAAIKCKDGIIVWNGHHRFSAHKLAQSETIKVRYWAELDRDIASFVNA